MLLVFNIFTYYVRSHLISYASDEITVIPKFFLPQLFPQLWKCFKYLFRRYTFHYLYYLCRRVSGRCFEKNMHMILHHLHRVYSKLILICYSVKDSFGVVRYLFYKYIFPVFRCPNEVVFQVVDSVRCPSNAHAVLYQKSSNLATGLFELIPISSV
jgi:hypothetical protein